MLINRVQDFLNKNIFLLVIVLSIISFFTFYPQRYENIDERNYLYNAQALSEGSLKLECDGTEGQYAVEDYCVYKYNLGTSFFLLPLANHPNLVVIIPFLIFLLSIYIVHKYWDNPLATVLFAAFPIGLWLSRTLLSETFSAFLILISILLLRAIVKKEKEVLNAIFLGIVFGLLVWVKYTNILFILPFYLAFIFKQYSESKDISVLFKNTIISVLSSLIVIIPMLMLNNDLYGGYLRSGYYFSREELSFEFSNIFFMGVFYFLALNIWYPGMLIFSFRKSKFLWMVIPAFIFIVLTSTFTGNNVAIDFELNDLIAGPRLIYPIIPIFIVSYGSLLYKKLKDTKYISLLIILLLIYIPVVHIGHWIWMSGAI